jgi:phage terminase large subunit
LSDLQIDTAAVFEPLLEPARYKGGHGGRGSGKSHFFAEMLIEDSLRAPGEMGEGLHSVCIREVQKTLKQSAKLLLENKLEKFNLGEADGFKVFNDVIKTPGDGLIIFQGMTDHTADSIKSLEGFHRAWVEEAQGLTKRSLGLLRPTIRWEDKQRSLKSELWFGWNPRRKVDPVDMMFRDGELPTGAICVEANWSDNPWFPSVLEQERLDCLRDTPDQYEHIWEGGYATVTEGAYFAKDLLKAKSDGRIGNVAADPLMTLRAFWDIGGTGSKADATAIWIAQFVGREIRWLDYYEDQGQPLATQVNWLRGAGYEKALCVLPHDGEQGDKVYDVSYESALQQAGFHVEVVPNQGKGAAKMRVQAARRLFPSMWFNEKTTEAGRDALGWYHEKIDENRTVGLGPEHDWSSHGADAFGLGCVAYEIPREKKQQQYTSHSQAGGWMG